VLDSGKEGVSEYVRSLIFVMISIHEQHQYDPASRATSRDFDMQLAREVQSRTFPTTHPCIVGLDYYSDWRAASGLSGDYLDYFELPEGSLGLAIGDVAGKGMAAALLTSSLRSLARALRQGSCRDLAELTSAIDALFYEVCPDSSYATMFVARYDPVRGVLHYVNAGHEPPVVLRKTPNGYRLLELEPTGPVIGMLRKSSFHENAITLAPGDMLVAYTDGLCETANPRGEEWGFRRMLATIQASSYRKARDIVDRVMDAAENFASGCPQYDDMTLWLGRIDEPASRTLTMCESMPLRAVA
jgi:sigma-B regulation protein RsbU (phosphoserine phosphatase)